MWLQIFAGLVGNCNPSLRFSLHFGHLCQSFARDESKVEVILNGLANEEGVADRHQSHGESGVLSRERKLQKW